MHISQRFLLRCTSIAIIFSSLSVQAASLTWDADTATGGIQDGGGAWDTTLNNWRDGIGNVTWNNASPDNAIFGAGAGNAGFVTNIVPITVGNITFNPAGSGNYTLTNTAANPITLSNTIITNNANASLNAVLAGTSFTKEGAAQLTMRPPANNSYSGATVVNAGIIALNSSTASRVLIAGDLIINAGATVTNTGSSGPIADAATVTINTGGTFAGGSDIFSSLVLAGGNVIQLSTETLTAFNVDARSGAVLQNSSSAKLDGNLTKSTSGTVTLTSKGSTAANGGLTNTIINEGTLILDYVQNSSKLNDTGNLTLNGGTLLLTNGSHSELVGTFTLTGGVITNASGTAKFTMSSGNYDVRTGTVHSVLAGAAGLVKTTPGLVILSGVHTYSGGTTISAGTLQLGDGSLSGTINSGAITNNATLILNPGTPATFSTAISGSGSVVKNGSGTAALTPLNSYQGSTTLSNGVLSVDGDATLGDGTGTLNLSGGTFSSTANRAPLTASIANPINLNADSAITTLSVASSVDLNFSSDSVGGNSGTLTLRNDGADQAADEFNARFSGAFSFNRPIIIDNGAVGKTRLNSFNSIGTTQIFNGVISGNGAFRRDTGVGFPGGATAGGTTILNALNTYSGDTTISSGALFVNGALGGGAVTVSSLSFLGGNGLINGPITLQTRGVLSAGMNIGTLTISNTLTFASTSTNICELNKTLGINDLVRGITTVTYNGFLIVTNVSGTLAANDTFKLFDASIYAGNFSTLILPALSSGLSWDATGLTNNGTIKVIGAGGSSPQISSTTLAGSNLILAGTGGTAGDNYYVLTSTNLALPFASWKSIATNQFAAGGNFSFTNAINPAVPALFYLLQVP